MLESFCRSLTGKIACVLLIVLLGLAISQPEAYASKTTPEQNLSKIDSIRFEHAHSEKDYTPALDTLSSRCSSNPTHIADISAYGTGQLFKNGHKFDNMSLLQQALDATKSGIFGMSCEEIFATLIVLIEGGV